MDTFGWWLLGLMCCGLFTHGFRRAFDLAAMKSGFNPQLVGPVEEELPSDDFAIKNSKRFKRGARCVNNVKFVPELAITVWVMTPFHHLMCFLFGQSKLEATDTLELVLEINQTCSKCVCLFHASFEHGDGFRFLRLVPGLDLRDSAWRAYIRREFLRAIGGLFVRVVDPHQSGLTALTRHMMQSNLPDVFADDIVGESLAALQPKHTCCVSSSQRGLLSFLCCEPGADESQDARSPRMSRTAKQRARRIALVTRCLRSKGLLHAWRNHWRGFTLFVERLHSQNQRRARVHYGKANHT